MGTYEVEGMSEFERQFKDCSVPLDGFPFESRLSLEGLFSFWEEAARGERLCTHPVLANEVLRQLEAAPELRGEIHDLSVLQRQKKLLPLLMSVIYPSATQEHDLIASSGPFNMDVFYATPQFRKIAGEEISNSTKPGALSRTTVMAKVQHAYFIILETLYNHPCEIEVPSIYQVEDPVSGMRKYYKITVDKQFVNLQCKGDLPELSPEEIEELLQEIGNLQKWMQKLPPEKFVFTGFITFHSMEVTGQEIISSLKHDLLERESIISQEKFYQLRDKLRILFKMKNLKIGLLAVPEDRSAFKQYARKIGESFIYKVINDFKCQRLGGSIYDRVLSTKQTQIIPDLTKWSEATDVERFLIESGIKSIAVAPLIYKDEIIGMLELGSSESGGINNARAFQLPSVLSFFAIAVKRSMEDFENNIQAVIKEECTAIHPSVEWRFRRAAVNLIAAREENDLSRMEEIVFEDVYPLYGMSDIRNSSTHRNDAIVSDLVEHLRMCRDILLYANQVKPMPFLDELNYRIDKHIRSLRAGLSSGDEVSIIDFVQLEVEKLFDHIATTDRNVSEMIENYKKAMDPVLGIFYRKRKDFEESVAMINETVSTLLDKEEQRAQEMFPHYFEKYKTDGVEHGIYIGPALVEHRKYDPVYLKNLRLWQLLVMVMIVRKTVAVLPGLRMPLETTHLLLVHNSTLSIRFRQDEKQFDVDGTYNIRYEIMKKRIDKAFIRGTKERLTQPGKIAIVYTQDKEAQEYRRYLEYLQYRRFITGEIEDHELEDLQGVHGLRAFRITVNVEDTAAGEIDPAEVETAVNEFTIA